MTFKQKSHFPHKNTANRLRIIACACSILFSAQAYGMDTSPVNSSNPRFPFEEIRGLYYFSDQGLYAEQPDPSKQIRRPQVLAARPAPATAFSEDLHAGRSIDFENRLVLSFDDVVFDDSLDKVLDILKAHNIKGVFFLTAVHIGEADRSVVRRKLERIIREGHEIGDHSYGHPEMDRGKFADGKHDVDDILDQFRSLEDLVDRILGRHYDFRYVRPPFGIRGNTAQDIGGRMSYPGLVDQVCRIMGREMILWHINSLDFTMAYDTKSKYYMSSSQVIDACIQRISASRGGVVLFHSNKRLPKVLDAILKRLETLNETAAQPYGFAAIDDLLAIKYGPEILQSERQQTAISKTVKPETLTKQVGR